jgi:energy-coupling factor transporter ATP-binding protein EcfA2
MKKNVSMQVAKESRYRGYFVQRSYYYETHDENGNVTSSLTHDEWKEQVRSEWLNVVGLDYLAIVFHDKDVHADGSQKPLHAHALVKYIEAKTSSSVRKHFGLSLVSANCQHTNSYVDTARYLIHVSEKALNEKKHIYKITDVTMVDFDSKRNLQFVDLMARKEDKKSLAKSLEKTITDYCVSVRTGEMNVIDVGVAFRAEYGELEWKKYKTYFENAKQEYFDDRLEFYSNNPRLLTTVLITGRGGGGKSKLAKSLGDLQSDGSGIHKVAAKGRGTTFDFAGGYQGEKVSIANEFTTGMGFRQFCDVFDTGEAPVVNSRNKDKPWFAEFAILTNSDTLEKFVNDLLFFSGKEFQASSRFDSDEIEQKRLLNKSDNTVNALGQVRRRLAYYVEVVEDTGFIFYDYNENWVDKLIVAPCFVEKRCEMGSVINGLVVTEGLTSEDVRSLGYGYADVSRIQKYHKGIVRVYGLINARRELEMDKSYKLLGSMNFKNLHVNSDVLALQVKTLIDGHNVYADDTDVLYEDF